MKLITMKHNVLRYGSSSKSEFTMLIRKPSFFLVIFFLYIFSVSTRLAAQGPVNQGFHTGNEWIDPDHSEPAGTHYHLYATPSRGADTEASYLIYLPPDYEKDTAKRYPVLYWLHGGSGSQIEGTWMVARIDAEICAGSLPPFIVVLPQALPDVRYINSKDGTRPVEDVIIHDLLPHIDATYRTIATRKGRAIEGMSMGGYGTLHLGLKYPELFGTVSALAPSIKPMSEEPPVVTEPFGNDPAYWNQLDPTAVAKVHAAEIIKSGTHIRIYVGDRDPLLKPVTEFHGLLTSLGIAHDFAVVPGAEHRYDEIISKMPGDPLQFWKAAFAQ
jgi:endo-1,4-beta-xylanase